MVSATNKTAKAALPHHAAPISPEQQVQHEQAWIELRDGDKGEQRASERPPLPFERRHREHRHRNDDELDIAFLERVESAERDEDEWCEEQRARRGGRRHRARSDEQTREQHEAAQPEPQRAQPEKFWRHDRKRPWSEQKRWRVLVLVDAEDSQHLRLPRLRRIVVWRRVEGGVVHVRCVSHDICGHEVRRQTGMPHLEVARGHRGVLDPGRIDHEHGQP